MAWKSRRDQLARAQRIADEVMHDPVWRDRPEDEQYAEYVRRVHAPGDAEVGRD